MIGRPVTRAADPRRRWPRSWRRWCGSSVDHELELLLGTFVDSLTKLAILLHVYADPVAVYSPEALAVAIGRRRRRCDRPCRHWRKQVW